MLTKVFRQRDATFVDILNELRVGKLSNRSAALLRKLKHTDLSPWTRGGVEPTRLNCYNADVDRINDAALARLHAGGDGLRTFDAQDSGAEPYLGSLRKNGAFPERLQLKVGAQVMLLVNLDVEAGLVNGSRGVVTGFASEQGKKDASLRTEDVTGVVVKFTTGRTQTISRDVKAIEEGNVQKAKRAQFPLRLAWAISIHKSQGQTLDLLEVDLRGCFEYGQAYTAVSRATSMDRLRVLNFDLAGVKAHARVVRFHDDLVARNPAVLHDAALAEACRQHPDALHVLRHPPLTNPYAMRQAAALLAERGAGDDGTHVRRARGERLHRWKVDAKVIVLVLVFADERGAAPG